MISAKRFRSQWWIAALMSVAVPMAAASAAQTMGQSGTVNAQWRSYQLYFNYTSMYTYYNCYAFEDKLEQILKRLGAKPDVHVVTTGCWGGSNIGNMLTSRIQVKMPATDGTDGESFVAGYKPVVLSTRDSASDQWRSGDCELLEEVRRQLLPALGLSVTKDEVSCFPGQPTLHPQSLEVQALLAQPTK